MTHFHQKFLVLFLRLLNYQGVYVYFFDFQRRTQRRTWGCGAGGAEASWGNTKGHLSLSPDCRGSPERSLCPAAIHTRLLPHSPGPPGVVCNSVQRCSPGPQPLDQKSSLARAHRSHPAIWLAFPSTSQPVWAIGGVWWWRAGSGGASSGGSAGCDSLSAVVAADGGLEGGSAKGIQTSQVSCPSEFSQRALVSSLSGDHIEIWLLTHLINRQFCGVVVHINGKVLYIPCQPTKCISVTAELIHYIII